MPAGSPAWCMGAWGFGLPAWCKPKQHCCVWQAAQQLCVGPWLPRLFCREPGANFAAGSDLQEHPQGASPLTQGGRLSPLGSGGHIGRHMEQAHGAHEAHGAHGWVGLQGSLCCPWCRCWRPSLCASGPSSTSMTSPQACAHTPGLPCPAGRCALPWQPPLLCQER